MLIRWFYSQTYTDPELGHVFPICRAYGHHWHLPRSPQEPDGWALVQMACGQHQLEAAKQDSRVMVLPPLFDRSPLPDVVVAAHGFVPATGQITASLSSTKPAFHKVAAEWFSTRVLRRPLTAKSMGAQPQNPDLATFLSRLAEIEPRFGHEMQVN